jgi:hypothetical protein
MVATAGLKGLEDYLYGSRGRMRMSVYREAGAGYLARTKDLTPDADRMRDAGGKKFA